MGPREERHINGAGTEPRQRLVSAVNTNEIMLDMISILSPHGYCHRHGVRVGWGLETIDFWRQGTRSWLFFFFVEGTVTTPEAQATPGFIRI